jgi:Rrf2 family protein
VLSSTAQYALNAVLHIAAQTTESEEPVRVHEVACAIGVPQNYLSKILHELARAGVLTSSRGKLGGFRLAQPAEKISLLSIVGRFDQLSERRSCLLGRPQCGDRTACPVHWRWKALAEQLAAFFGETTVGDLLNRRSAVPAGR